MIAKLFVIWFFFSLSQMGDILQVNLIRWVLIFFKKWEIYYDSLLKEKYCS